MYVPSKYQMDSANEVDAFIKTFDQVTPVWSDILTIDYFYHHHYANYDGGLSFLDRIYAKLGQFHPEWNVVDLKKCITTSNDPVVVYEDIVKFMLEDPRDVMYYGI